jgi:acetylornithine deacetylase/succinyl-diaminopimelate desuccinylase-like protein
MASVLALVRWFEETYPPHADEARWGFLGPSTLKPTVITVPNNKITKIPGSAVVEGDIRLTPFYDMKEAIVGAEKFIAALDQRIEAGDVPAGFPRVRTVSGQRGSVRLVAKGRFMEGIACQLDSPGLAVLTDAIKTVRGAEGAQPFAMTGSLPLVRDLQRQGFDVQITGFGRSTYYHAPNEQAKLEHFQQGFLILHELVTRL